MLPAIRNFTIFKGATLRDIFIYQNGCPLQALDVTGFKFWQDIVDDENNLISSINTESVSANGSKIEVLPSSSFLSTSQNILFIGDNVLELPSSDIELCVEGFGLVIDPNGINFDAGKIVSIDSENNKVYLGNAVTSKVLEGAEISITRVGEVERIYTYQDTESLPIGTYSYSLLMENTIGERFYIMQGTVKVEDQ